MSNNEILIPHQGCMTCGHKLCAKKVSLFENLDNSQLDKVTSLIYRKSVPKGNVVFKEGDIIESLYIINSGSLKISAFNKEGKEQILYILQEGDFIGDLALLKSTTSQFTCTAIKETHLCCIKNSDFLELIIKNKDILVNTMAYAHDRINSLEKLVQIVSTNEVDERLKFLLIHLSETNGKKTKEGMIIDIEITREDMANFVGVSRETISRKLSSFVKREMIKIIDSKTILLYNSLF